MSISNLCNETNILSFHHILLKDLSGKYEGGELFFVDPTRRQQVIINANSSTLQLSPAPEVASRFVYF